MAPDSPPQITQSSHQYLVPEIPIEIVSDEEIALIKAAFAAAAASRPSSSSLSPFHRNASSIGSSTRLSKRSFSGCSENRSLADIEDLFGGGGSSFPIGTQEKKKSKLVTESFLYLREKGMCVTDITATEWCEKKQEFSLLGGKPKQATKAMKAGSARHAVLEKEVIQKVRGRVESDEDVWALKIINFIKGGKQLLSDGLTRELPIISFAEGECINGVIDEIRMHITDTQLVAELVEIKTRAQNQLPSEPQRRNGRLQLMCYKHLLDNLISTRFPSEKFLELFCLNPNQILSDDIRESTATLGFPSETLDDLLRWYQNRCSILPLTHDRLILRYEYQKDQSLISEDEFLYDSSWVKNQLKSSLEFLWGEREASYVPEEERWKCRTCQYSKDCPINNKPEEEDIQQVVES